MRNQKNKALSVEAPIDSQPGVEAHPKARMYFNIGAVLAFVVSLGVFVRTMAPSTSFWDSGEFIATSYTLGIPHSPGTPLYVLLGRVATLLPLPLSIAGRVNFVSVLAGASGVLFAYLLTVRFLDDMLGRSASLPGALSKVFAGLVAAFFITFSHTYWINATESEVYALSVLFMAFMTWLSLKWEENPTGQHATAFVLLLFYILALTVGFHLGTILGFSGIFVLILLTKSKSFSNTEFLIACVGMAIFVADATLYRQSSLTLGLLGLFVLALVYMYVVKKSLFPTISTVLFILGISVHLYLYLRSGHNPSIDEADPETWRNLYAVLRREQYPTMDVTVRKASYAFQFQHFNNYFQSQFQMMSFYLGKLNIGSLIPLGLGVWGMVDHFSKHRKTFIMLFITFLVTSLGMIVYLNFSDSEVRDRDYFYLPAFYYFGLFIGIGVGSILGEFKRFAEHRGIAGVAPVVIPGLIFLAMPFFTAKRHFFEHDRSNNYVCQKYARNMLVGLEPNAVIFTNGDNDTFPLWYVQEVEGYRTDVRVVNLSLLNTPWYIKQVRDNEPQLELQWADAEIEQLMPFKTDQGIVLVRDIAVQHILRHVSRHRPIYFAVTVPHTAFQRYRNFMEMEGLVYRVIPKEGKNMINEAKLEENVWNVYDFDGVLTKDYKRDGSLYHPSFVNRLVQNYGAAFTQLGFVKAQSEDYPAAIRCLETALEVSPNMNSASRWLGSFYMENGDTLKALEFYKDQVQKRPGFADLYLGLASVYERIGNYPASVEALEKLLERDPDHRDAAVSTVGMLVQLNDRPRALEHVRRWLARHPNDEVFRATRDELMNPRPQVPVEEPSKDQEKIPQ